MSYRTLATLPKAPVIELPYWATSIEFHRHAEYMLASTAHWQPLINGYSDHIPQDFRDNAPMLDTFPSRESFAILERCGARYAVFHLDLMAPVTIATIVIRRLDVDYARLPPAAREGRRTCGSTKSSAGRASLLRRRWRCCTRGRSPATRLSLARLDNHDAELNTWIVAWVAHMRCRASR